METILNLSVTIAFGKEFYYPVAKDDFADLLLTLMGRETFTRQQVQLLKSKGFTVNVESNLLKGLNL